MYKHKNGVVLRKLALSDLSRLKALKEESWWGTHSTSILNHEDQYRWYSSLPGSTLCMITEIDEMPTGIVIYSSIDNTSRVLSISASVFHCYRSPETNRRVFRCGTDFAFEILNMHRIEAEVLECNLAAQQLEIDFLGFKVEGCKRESVYKSGKYYNSLVIGLLRTEWSGQKMDSCNLNFSHERADELVEKSRKRLA